MHSHIQIPQLLLKYFCHVQNDESHGHISKVDYVFYFDLRKSVIDSEKKRLIGSEIDYFGASETKLNDEVEKPFADAVNKIVYNKLSELNKKDYESIKKFCYFSTVRSKNVLDSLLNSEFIIKRNGAKPEKIIELAEECDIYSDSKIDIIWNKTNIDYVIPNNCVIFLKSGYLIPLSPNVAVFLKSKGDNEQQTFLFNQSEISDEKEIIRINLAAVEVEKRNRGLIIAKKKDTLYEIARYLNIKPNNSGGKA